MEGLYRGVTVNLSHLASGATTLLSDVNGKHRDLNVLFDIAAEEKVTHLGSFAGFYNMLARREFRPHRPEALSTVEQLLSTGSRLLPETYRYFYDTLGLNGEFASISGGTDIISSFFMGSPISPVYAGECQVLGLGQDVQALNADGQPMATDERGELSCLQPFPSMPVKFMNDPDGEKYRKAYFEPYPNIWTHGDEVILTAHGGTIVLGRSDETLNINGNRVGPIEIMAPIENLSEIQEAAVVGLNIKGSDYPVLLVVLAEGVELTAELRQRIARTVLAEKPAFCLPAENMVFAVEGLPKAGVKLSLVAMKKVINGASFDGYDKLTPENQRYLDNIAALGIDQMTPARQRLAG